MHEDLLKQRLPEHRKLVLNKKRLCLFRRVLQQAGHGDTNLVDDIVSGFNLTGRLPEAGVLKSAFRPASQSVPLLREGARRAREAVLAECKSSGSVEVDQGVEEATMKELALGFIEGPIDPSRLPEGALLTRRFGVVQGETEEGNPRVRPIDDYKRSMVNASVTQTEKVVVHNLDVVAAMASAWMREHLKAGRTVKTVAKCWDLKAAYKQLALDDSSFELDSFFVIYSVTHGEPLIFKQRVLPFGSIASVTGFIRSGLGLWCVSVRLLALVWSMYFDDFLHLTQGGSARHAELVIGVFFRLLGWDVSADKLCPYDSCCKVLGVLFDLRQAHLGTIFVRNTEKRRSELSRALRGILEAGKMSPKESERLRGRLQFSSGQLFGRRAKSSLHALAKHSRQQAHALSNEVTEACAQLLEMLEDGPEREISSALGDVVHVFVDASFEPNGGFCGIGGVAYCGAGHVLRWFGCRIEPQVIKELLAWDGEPKETIIFELECMAVMFAYNLFEKVLANRSVVVFTDNQGVLGALVKGWSTSALGHAITLRVCILEEGLHSYFWYDRVPSASNPSDPLSRDDFSAMDAHLRCEISNADVLEWIKVLES